MTDERKASEGPTAQPQRLEVLPEWVGTRLDRLLAEQLGVSRAEVRRLLEAGRVQWEGRRLGLREKGRLLPGGASLEIEAFRPAAEREILPDARPGITNGILAEGPGWLAVDKCAGAPVHPLREGETGTVLNAIVALHPEVQGVGEGIAEAGLRSGVVHRLDVETSGVLLVASEDATWKRLRAAFREHRVAKRYRAIVLGDLRIDGIDGDDEERVLDLELGLVVAQHRPARVRVVELAEGEERGGVWRSRQSVVVRERFGDATLVEIRPTTGFLHQIRATLAHIGHPVAGDASYRGDARDDTGAERQMLHAAQLAIHEIEAESPDPQDFVEVLERLRARARG